MCLPSCLTSTINCLPRTCIEFLKGIRKQTGFHGTLLLGGADPSLGRNVTIAYVVHLDRRGLAYLTTNYRIHEGKTKQTGAMLHESTDRYALLEEIHREFIAKCFCKRFHIG